MKMPRSLWHRMTWILTTTWIVLLVMAVAAQRILPNPQWFLIHIASLGVIGTSILVWTWHFADALTRRQQSQAHQLARLLLLTVGTLLLGIALGASGNVGAACALAGSLLIIVSVTWHSYALYRATRSSFVSPGAVTLRFHLAGGILLVVGTLFAIVMALDVTMEKATQLWPAVYRLHDGLAVAHIFFMVLGFVGLTVLGTLATFGATVARTRMAPGAIRTAMRSLPLLVAAIVIGVAGAIAGQSRIAGIAVMVWVFAGMFGVLIPMFRTWRGSMVGVGDGWTIGAGTLWFEIAASVWAWQLLTTSDISAARNMAMGTYGLLLAAGALQLVLGSLTYLLPVVAGGGPAKLRATIETLEPTAGARFLTTNGSIVVALLPLPVPFKNAALVLAGFTALLSFALLIYAVARQHSRQGAAVTAAPPRAAEAVSSPQGGASSPAGPRPMPNPRLALGAVVAVLAVALVGTVSTVAAPSGQENTISTGETTTVNVTVSGMAFTPDHIEVPRGNRLLINFTNTGDQRHDLVLATGPQTGPVSVGESTQLDAGIISGNVDGWCSMVGHKQMGMTLTISATGSGTAHESHGTGNTDGTASAGGLPEVLPTTADLMADPGTDFQPWNARLDPASAETTHHITLDVIETEKLIAPGRTQKVWTFGGQTPGPVLHGKVGDTFVITLTNKGTMGHSIDFHAGDVSPNAMRTIEPGESLTYTFQAKRSGIWMYHCSTMPMSLHIANGMYGAVIIDPPGLEPVDKEYVLIQAEQYWGKNPDEGMDAAALATAIPSAMTFNGFPFQYDHAPLTANTGDRVRIWVLDAGPNLPWSFHVVGTQFDTVWTEGAYSIYHGESAGIAPEKTNGGNDAAGNATGGNISAENTAGGSDTLGSAGAQVLPLLAAQGGFVEFVPQEPGNYAIVNHAMTYAERGAHGILAVK